MEKSVEQEQLLSLGPLFPVPSLTVLLVRPPFLSLLPSPSHSIPLSFIHPLTLFISHVHIGPSLSNSLSVLPSSWMDCPQSQLSLSSDPVDTEVRSAPVARYCLFISLYISKSLSRARSLSLSLWLSPSGSFCTSH